MSKTTRVCIYPKDIQRIMGKSYKQARLYLQKIKNHHEKKPHQLVSIDEFCRFTGLPPEDVRRCILD